MPFGLSLIQVGEDVVDVIVDDDDTDAAGTGGSSSKAKSSASLIGIAVGCVLGAIAVVAVIAIVVYNKHKK